MAYEFVVPPEVAQDGEGFVVNWFKDAGQAVRAGELLVEVQFEKTAIELEAPVDGVVSEIVTARGETVTAGQLLCRIVQSAAEPAPPAAIESRDEAPSPPGTPGRPGPAQGGGPVRATPAARRVAREHGVDLALVTGTGPDGRIGEEDVRAHLATTGAVDAAPGASPAPETSPGAVTPPLPPGWQRQPLSPAQRTTGQLMLASLQQTAQYTLARTVDATALSRWRSARSQDGVRVSWTDLFHRAVVVALLDMPIMQAQLQGDELWVPEGVNLGFAVARDDDLFAPVIVQAHRLDLTGLQEERERLTAAVGTGRAAAEELRGGTFTVTNLGTLGIDHFTPVLNPPQPAILGLGRLVQRPIFRGEAVEAALETTLSLTLDHRIINGATGARFLRRLAELLEQPGPWLDED